jgi:hypothetical protein
MDRDTMNNEGRGLSHERVIKIINNLYKLHKFQLHVILNYWPLDSPLMK